MTFASRHAAGKKLGHYLVDQGVRADLVVGLPRGGVIVAAEVSRILHLPLHVLIVRKIGHPRFREFAVGALAEADVVLLDRDVLERSAVDPEALDAVIHEEKQRLVEYRRKFELEPVDFQGKRLLIIDDGLATGATTEAAVRSARIRGAAQVIVAVPVASANAIERLKSVSDDILALLVDPHFEAVGQYYHSFPQTTDEEVLEALRDSANPNL